RTDVTGIVVRVAAAEGDVIDRGELLFRLLPIPPHSLSRRRKADAARFLRDIVGNPFRPVTLDPEWLTSTFFAIARGMYEPRNFTPMPILADALQDAGCDSEDILDHCRQPGEHVRGCWVVDLILGKK